MDLLILLSLRIFLQVQVDSTTTQVIDCELKPISGSSLSYQPDAKLVTAVADCTRIFRNGFE